MRATRCVGRRQAESNQQTLERKSHHHPARVACQSCARARRPTRRADKVMCTGARPKAPAHPQHTRPARQPQPGAQPNPPRVDNPARHDRRAPHPTPHRATPAARTQREHATQDNQPERRAHPGDSEREQRTPEPRSEPVNPAREPSRPAPFFVCACVFHFRSTQTTTDHPGRDTHPAPFSQPCSPRTPTQATTRRPGPPGPRRPHHPRPGPAHEKGRARRSGPAQSTPAPTPTAYTLITHPKSTRYPNYLPQNATKYTLRVL